MALPDSSVIRSYPGGAAPTYLSASLSNTYASGQTLTVANTTGWYEVSASGYNTTNPLGTSGPFTLVVDYGLNGEEKILCASGAISLGVNTTIFVYNVSGTNGRGYDGTTAVNHSAGSSTDYNVFPVATAIEQAQFNLATSKIGNGTVILSGTTAGGDLAGTYPNPTLKVIGTSGTWYPADGQGTAITVDNVGRVTGLSGLNINITQAQVSGLVSFVNSTNANVSINTNDINTVSGQVATLSGQFVTLSGQVGDLSGQVSTLSGQYLTTSGQVDNNTIAISGLNSTVSGESVAISGLSTRIDTLSSTTNSGFATVDTQISGLNVVVSGQSATIAAEANNIAVLSGQYVTLSGNLVTTNSNVATLSGQFVTLSGQYLTTSGVVTNNTNNIATLSGQMITANNGISTNATNISTLSGSVSTISGKQVTDEANIASLSGSLVTLSGQFVTTSGRTIFSGTTAGGDLTGTYPNPTLITISGVSGTYGSATQTPLLSIDSNGRVTNAQLYTIQIAESQVNNLTTDMTSISGNIASVSGKQATDQSNIATLSGNLATLSGQYVTTSGLVTNQDGYISTISGKQVTDEANIASTSGSLATLSGQYVITSGIVVTNTSNIAATSGSLATLSGQFVTLSGSYNTTSGIVTNNTGYIATISGKQITDEANIASLSGSLNTLSGQYVATSGIVTNHTSYIATISGKQVADEANIASISGSLATVSGVAYAALPKAGGTISGNLTVTGTLTAGSLTVSGGNVLISGSTANGDLSGTYPSPTVAKIQGASVSPTTPTNNQVLRYSTASGAWYAGTGNALFPTATISGNYTATPNDYAVVNATVAPITVTLPNAPANGSVVSVASLPTSTYNVVITASGSDTIPGGNFTLAGNTVFNSVSFYYDSVRTEWLISSNQFGNVAGGDLGGYYPNPTVDRLQGTPVSSTPPNTGQVLGAVGGVWAPITTSGLGTPGPGGANGYYGAFYDSTTQSATSTTVASGSPVLIGNTFTANGITTAASGIISFGYTGTYLVAYTIQLSGTGNADIPVNVWFRKNGANVQNTMAQFSITNPPAGSTVTAAVTHIIVASGNDNFQIYWQPATTNATIVPIASGSSHPAAPSVFVSVSQIMYNQTGTYTVNAVAASGTNQASATPLTLSTYAPITGATASGNNVAGAGVVLATPTYNGQWMQIHNQDPANWLLVYPNSGATIDQEVADGPIWIPPSAFWEGVATTTLSWDTKIEAITSTTLNVSYQSDGGQAAINLPSTGTPGTYGTVSGVPVVTTDPQGRVSTVTVTGIQIAQNQVTGLSGNLSALSGSITTTNSNLATLSGQYATTSGIVTNQTGYISTLSGQMVTANANIASTSGSLATLSGQYVTTSGITTTNTSNIATLSGQMVTANSNIASTSGSLATLSGQFVSLSGAYATTSGNLNTTNTNVANLSGQYATLSGQYATTSGIVTNQTSYIAATSGSLATLSGQFVALSGSYNTTSGIVTNQTSYIATLSGQIVTLSGSDANKLPLGGGTVTGTLNVNSPFNVNGNVSITGTETISGALNVNYTINASTPTTNPPINFGGGLSYSDVNIMAGFNNSVNNYNQVIIQNTNSGTSASTNLNVSNNLGTSGTNYGEFGMNSSNFTGTGAFNTAGAVYLSSASTDLAIGTYGNNAIHFVTNSATSDAMTITSGGNVVVASGFTVSGTSTQIGNVSFSGAVTVSGAAVMTSGSAVGGDLTGTIGNAKVTKLQGYTVSSGAPVANTMLVYSGSQWTSGPAVSGTTGTGGIIPYATNPLLVAPLEQVVVTSGVLASGTAATLNVVSGGVYVYTAAPTSAWQIQITNAPTTVGQAVTVTVGTNNGATAYLPSGFTINGYTVNGGTTLPAHGTAYTNTITVTAFYQGGSIWTSADATINYDFYAITLICTAANTYVMLLGQTKF